MKKIHLLLLWALPSCFAYSQGNRVQFEHLSVKDGLSQLSVISIFQDSRGFLWFGTRDGLNKYDGYSFHIFRESDPDHYISNSHIEAIAEDGKGCLWVGTRRGLNRYDHHTGRFEQYDHTDHGPSISDNNTVCLLKDYRGNLWIGTTKGLDCYIPETDDFVHCAFDGLPGESTIYSLAEDHDENLWIGASNGLYIYNRHTKETRKYAYHPEDDRSISQDRIAALFCDSRGRVWVGFYQQGVCLYDAKNDDFIRFKREDGLNDNMIRCITEDKEGNILVGTFNGLNSFDERNRKFTSAYSADHIPISNFSVYDVLCDRSGTVWVGTYSGGVSYCSPYNQRFRFHDPGMQGRMLFGIVGPMVEHATGIWMGTEGGGLLFFDRRRESYTYYRLPDASERSFNRNIVKSLLVEGNRLWIGTTCNIVYRFDTGRREFIRPILPAWGTIHYMLFRDSGKNLWVGSSGENALGYLKPDGQPVHPLPLDREQTFSPPNIRCMLEDSAGIYYIGSFGTGLYRYSMHANTGKRFSHMEGDSSGLASDRITSMCRTKDGGIWLSTLGGGMSRFNHASGTFENYGKRHGLASEAVYAIVADRNNKLWMSTSAGISQFDPQTGTFTNFDKNNGIRISEFTPGSGLVTADNEIFFGGNDGFVSFYPQQFKTNSYIPPVFITKISVNNRPLDDAGMIAGKLRLDHNQSSITIEFSALNFIYPHQNQYSYKLEGFDREWNGAGNRRTAYYANIRPGDYTFRVKGSNNDGVWNEQEATLTISISRPPWNTWWAWMLYIAVTAAGIAWVIHSVQTGMRLKNDIRIRQMEQENMEEQHRARIQNLIASREKLRELSGQKPSFAFPELPASSSDSRFMDSVYRYINDHLTDPDMNMDDFCKETGMSRSNFYRKIRSISDLNPNELIRNTRLQFAAKYLRETDLSVSEIAYTVGFSSPSYFTKTFRAYFHMAPSEMRKETR